MYLAEQLVMHVDSELLSDEPGLGTQESKQAALSLSINNLNCPMEASSWMVCFICCSVDEVEEPISVARLTGFLSPPSKRIRHQP